MRRVLFIALLAILVSDVSGLCSLVVPEPCAIGATESAPDGGCPAFCVRCTCACCACSVVYNAPTGVMAELLPAIPVPFHSLDRLRTGVSPDILHVPKPILT
jgi:hypothetical protein